jgi:hypothetical protein
MAQDVRSEAANGRQTAIAGDDPIAALGFDVVEKRQHSIGADVIQPKIRDGAAQVVGQKQEEEPECVPVGTDRMLAGTTDAAKVVCEEGLHQRQK